MKITNMIANRTVDLGNNPFRVISSDEKSFLLYGVVPKGRKVKVHTKREFVI